MRQAVGAHDGGDHVLAARSYREALRLSPSTRGAYQNLALLAEHAGRREDAVTLARMELDSHPELVSPRLNAAVLLLRAGRPDEALDAIAPLGGAAPAALRIGAHHLRAQRALTAGALDTALQELDAALELADSLVPGLQLDRALVLAHMGAAARANVAIDSILTRDPSQRRALRLRALIAQ